MSEDPTHSNVIRLPIARSALSAAWEEYRQHRSKEVQCHRLASDPAHLAESARLHAIFMALYPRSFEAVVLEFRGRA